MKRIIIILMMLAPLFVNSLAAEQKTALDCSEFYTQANNLYEQIVEESGTNMELRIDSMKGLRLALIDGASQCHLHSPTMTIMASINIEAYENNTALEYAKAAVSSDPNSAEANAILGLVLCMYYQFDIGIPYLEKAAEIDKTNYTYASNLCSNYELAKRYTESVSACDRAIETAEDSINKAASTYVRGRAYLGLGMTDEAEKDFQEAKKAGFNGDQYYTNEHLGMESNNAPKPTQ